MYKEQTLQLACEDFTRSGFHSSRVGLVQGANSARPSVSLSGRGGLHSSCVLLVRASGLSSPECKPFYVEQTIRLACTPFMRNGLHSPRVVIVGGAYFSARPSVSLSSRSELFSSRVPKFARADLSRPCIGPSGRGRFHSSRVVGIVCGAKSARPSVNPSGRSGLLSSPECKPFSDERTIQLAGRH